ncbi:hypothetical protein GW12_17400 [Acinetobacter sp. HR7]|nr:hypothetical protein GW12_17400 [Acinetobacter sp. HR7]
MVELIQLAPIQKFQKSLQVLSKLHPLWHEILHFLKILFELV